VFTAPRVYGTQGLRHPVYGTQAGIT
jgi:hypothetical protein